MNTPASKPTIMALGKLDTSFDQVVVVEYYDGLTKCVARSNQTQQSYLFEMLDWDDQQDIRIFGVSSLPCPNFVEIIAALTRYDQPRWPMWFPHLNNLLESDLNSLYASIQALLSTAERLDIVFAWRRSDNDIFLVKETFSAAELSLVDWLPWNEATNTFSWFDLLGLP